MSGKLKFKTIEIGGLQPAIMGARNPMDSWSKSDSRFDHGFILGEADADLLRRLIQAGDEHAKFLRQIQVWANFTLPRYMWQEMDTYKFFTKNSCSTMHTLGKHEYTIDNFYMGEQEPTLPTKMLMENICSELNVLHDLYMEEKNYEYVKTMKRILPESFLQMRTVNFNYAELMRIYRQRKNHRLNEEWGQFIEWCERLPYFKQFVDYMEGAK